MRPVVRIDTVAFVRCVVVTDEQKEEKKWYLLVSGDRGFHKSDCHTIIQS